MNLCISLKICPSSVHERLSRALLALTISVVLAMSLVACGGSAGGDAGDIARDGLDDTAGAGDASANPLLQDQPLNDALVADGADQDVFSCDSEIDIAEFFLTEIDRQWSCQISSVVGDRLDEIYFARNGTAFSANDGTWYWNRNLPTAEVNLASPGQPSMLMSDIGSSNTLLVFKTTSEAGVEQVYDCVLVYREVDL